ncbi:MAG: hypothetical protein JWR12_1092 [Mucilaginibacter sp.]|nr:hypothetical protein [Mucilaginibacter sp.]
MTKPDDTPQLARVRWVGQAGKGYSCPACMVDELLVL